MATGSIDINASGKYPIVLSDALLGKATEESYTSIRYNHKPEPSASVSPSPIQLQPSKSAGSDYGLSFSDDSGTYKYNGVQTSEDGQYALIFNPEKKHFVLHRLDSTFDMNLVSAPWENDTSTLRSQYAQIESTTKAPSEIPQRKLPKTSKNPQVTKSEPKRRKPTQAKKRIPVREPTPEVDDNSDDGLTIEYPDARSTQQHKPQLKVIQQQNTSEEEEEEDAEADVEGEFEEQQSGNIDHLTLLSPANNNTGGLSDEDLELDLEAELEQALKETTEGAGDDESDESEEE